MKHTQTNSALVSLCGNENWSICFSAEGNVEATFNSDSFGCEFFIRSSNINGIKLIPRYTPENILYEIVTDIDEGIDNIILILLFLTGCSIGSWDHSFLKNGAEYDLFSCGDLNNSRIIDLISKIDGHRRMFGIWYVGGELKTVVGHLNSIVEAVEGASFELTTWGKADGLNQKSHCMLIIG